MARDKLYFVSKTECKNLIIFIHGLFGGESTWVCEDGEKSIMNYLQEDLDFSSKFDFAAFNYESKVSDFISQWQGLAQFFGFKIQSQKNLSVDDLSDLLRSEIEVRCKQYDKIILVAHSMGGLIAKSVILKLLNKQPPQNISSYISVAVPHNGADLAIVSSQFFRHTQVTDLKPLENAVNALNTQWISFGERLPLTLYIHAKNDIIVSANSSRGYESRAKNITDVNTSYDHFSVVKPDQADDLVVLSIRDACLEAIDPSKSIMPSQSDRGEQSISIYPSRQLSTEEFRMVEEGRKQQITLLNKKVRQAVEKDLEAVSLYERDFKNKTGEILSYAELLQEVEAWEFIMICGIGGIGKSVVLRKLFIDLSETFTHPFFIFCDARIWENSYSKELVNAANFDDKVGLLLNGFESSINYADIQRLHINKGNADVAKIIFIDGLNEISAVETRKAIIHLLALMNINLGFKVVLTTRHRDQIESKKYEIFTIEKINQTILAGIINSKFGKSLSDYSARNRDYLSLPFFLNIALKNGNDTINGYSSFINAHVLKNVEQKDRTDFLKQLSSLVNETYESHEQLFIPRNKVTPVLEKKYVTAKILVEGEKGFVFEHHLINEYLLAYRMAKSPHMWIDSEFDRITFGDKKSFEVIQMVLEQITETDKADLYLKAVYNWNFYGVMHCIKYVDSKYSREIAVVLVLILTEKLFDNFAHTRLKIVEYLAPLYEKFKIQNIKEQDMAEIISLANNSRRSRFREIVEANSKNFDSGPYSQWYKLFSHFEAGYPTEIVARITDQDPLLGWSAANVLKRNRTNLLLQGQLVILYEAATNYTQKWRVVHALGSSYSEYAVEFLIGVLEKNQFFWVSYGAIRSLLEIALFESGLVECQLILDKVFQLFENTIFGKGIITELLACLQDKFEREKLPVIEHFFQKAIVSSSFAGSFVDKNSLSNGHAVFKQINDSQ